MKHYLKKGLRTVLLCCSVMGSLAAQAESDEIYTLSNMERERAELIQTFLSPTLEVADRLAKINRIKARLVDMERMVVRDDRLIGSENRWVRRAYENYELTFLVHAAAENKRLVIDQWLSQQGLSTRLLLATTVGRR